MVNKNLIFSKKIKMDEIEKLYNKKMKVDKELIRKKKEENEYFNENGL
jgi:hypothetical protein